MGNKIEVLRNLDFRSGLGDSAELLYGMVRAMKPKVCVEIGSARGKSACYIGTALKENGQGKLFAIDPHTVTDWNDSDSKDTFKIIHANLAQVGVQDYVQIVRKTSEEAAKGWTASIDLLFIDGDHSYEGVERDWKLFSPFVSKFGLIVFHDTIWDLNPDPAYARADMGVPKFVENLRKQGYPVTTFPTDFGVSWVQPVVGGVSLIKAQ